jgi:hypothetical protein
MKYVYGPVPSRRLGQSLGVDPILNVATREEMGEVLNPSNGTSMKWKD